MSVMAFTENVVYMVRAFNNNDMWFIKYTFNFDCSGGFTITVDSGPLNSYC